MAARVFSWNTERFHHWASQLVHGEEFDSIKPCLAASQAKLSPDGIEFGCECFSYMLTENDAQGYPFVQPESRDYSLLLLSARNRVTFNLLSLVIEVRREWLKNPKPEYLTPIRYAEIKKRWEARWPNRYIDESIISRVLRNTVVETHGRQILLSQIFPKKIQWLSQCLREIICRDDAIDSDIVLAIRLREKLNLSISPKTVQRARIFSGIPSQRDRLGKHYGRLQASRPLRRLEKSILAELPDNGAVYELHRCDGEEIYPLGTSAVLYIGASQNLRRRLYSYIAGHAHTDSLRMAIADGVMLRYMRVDNPMQFETILIEGFSRRYGSLPRLNFIFPRVHA